MPNDDLGLSFRFFDPDEDYFVAGRRLPHWSQAGTICFITWRTLDSMPRPVIETWLTERKEWLIRRGIDPQAEDWRDRLTGLPVSEQRDFHRKLSARWEWCLDECHGECVLRRLELARIVADSLRYFDGKRYILTDFVIMPNHIHVLAAFQESRMMMEQCASWKHYTAAQFNKALGRHGRFWEVEGFDHLVRSSDQFEHLRDYIAENPSRANLPIGEFIHYSRTELA